MALIARLLIDTSAAAPMPGVSVDARNPRQKRRSFPCDARAPLQHRGGVPAGRVPDEMANGTGREQLRLTTLPVAHIARDVGYTSEYAFNRTFARGQGVPPGRYRTAFLAAESAVSASAEI
jgi:AraC-like DNA-binding protein